MTAKGKPLDVMIADAGYSEEFVDYAMEHKGHFSGDLQKFIAFVEHLMEMDSENEQRAGTDPLTLIDSGSKRVEHDYTGDNLTHGGYDHVDKNRRW